VGGFNVNYKQASGEDNDLSYKILNAGYKINFNRQFLVKHYHPTCINKYLKEQYRHGYWRVRMYFDHPHMVKGDDYTFWKDIVEIPIILAIFLSACLKASSLLSTNMLLYTLISFLVMLELFYGYIITKNIFDAIFLSYVMLLRSISRTIGFSSGIVSHFLPKYNRQSPA